MIEDLLRRHLVLEPLAHGAKKVRLLDVFFAVENVRHDDIHTKPWGSCLVGRVSNWPLRAGWKPAPQQTNIHRIITAMFAACGMACALCPRERETASAGRSAWR